MDHAIQAPCASPLSPAEIAGGLEWWRDAGVDLDFVDEPLHWLVEPEAETVPSLPAAFAAPRREESGGQAPAARIGGPRDAWPASLGAFAEWWMAEPTLDGGTVRDRAAPRGPQGAELMVLVPAPGQDDGEQLLTGRDGSVLAAMLRAMGLEPDTVYFASALPRHIPLPDWDSLARDGLGEVLAHHIGLVAPQRLIAFGPSILPLLGHDPAQIAKTSLRFNHEGSNVKLFGALDLGTLATKPARKAGFWQRWLEFSA
jgi:uracil-DNA glycosylase